LYIFLIRPSVPHAYRVKLEHCMHMSLCGGYVLDYVKLCEDVLSWLCASIWKTCDLTMVMMCECYVFNLVINRWCDYLFIILWWFEIRCIYFNNQMRIHVNIICLRWICVYNVVIIILHAFIFPLCWIYILPYVWQMVTYTLLWCRLAGWRRIVDMSFSRTVSSLLVFYHFDFGVLSSGTMIRIVGDFIILSYYVWYVTYEMWKYR